VLTEAPNDSRQIWTSSPRIDFSRPFLTCQLDSLFVIIFDVTAAPPERWAPFLGRLMNDSDDRFGFLIVGRDLVPTLFAGGFRIDNAALRRSSLGSTSSSANSSARCSASRRIRSTQR
jgi:hypothetical protein